MIKRVAVAIALVVSLDAAVIVAEPKAMDGVVRAGAFPYSQEQNYCEEVDETQLDEDEPDQDPVYDEEDPVYDEEDDYE